MFVVFKIFVFTYVAHKDLNFDMDKQAHAVIYSGINHKQLIYIATGQCTSGSTNKGHNFWSANKGHPGL